MNYRATKTEVRKQLRDCRAMLRDVEYWLSRNDYREALTMADAASGHAGEAAHEIERLIEQKDLTG